MIKQSLKKQTDSLKGAAKGKNTALDKDKRASITNVKGRKHIKKEKWKIRVRHSSRFRNSSKITYRNDKPEGTR